MRVSCRFWCRTGTCLFELVHVVGWRSLALPIICTHSSLFLLPSHVCTPDCSCEHSQSICGDVSTCVVTHCKSGFVGRCAITPHTMFRDGNELPLIMIFLQITSSLTSGTQVGKSSICNSNLCTLAHQSFTSCPWDAVACQCCIRCV